MAINLLSLKLGGFNYNVEDRNVLFGDGTRGKGKAC